MNKNDLSNKELTAAQRDELIRILMDRFEKNMIRHQGIKWAKVQGRLDAHPEKLWSLSEKERTGGDPDVVGYDKKTSEYIFYDCSAATPAGRRNVCYDQPALDARVEIQFANRE